MSALTQLNSRLDVGLQFADYNQRVGDARVAYDAAAHGIRAAPRPCIVRVGVPLENALQAYSQASTVWSDCISAYSCTFDKGSVALTKAQTQWTNASRDIMRAQSNLRALAGH